MISRRTKAAYYFLAGPAMKVSGVAYKWLFAPRLGNVRVHLGPGQKNYMDGWINVDANFITAKCDVFANLEDYLPFHDNSINAFYSHHVIEHLSNMEGHFRDVFRCLKPGGVYRVGGPNGDAAIRKFIANDLEWFSDFPDNRTSIGGKFENFIFCRKEHLTILTQSFLLEIMNNVGFSDIKLCAPTRDTYFPNYFLDCLPFEHETNFEFPHTIIMEGVKPDNSA